MGKLGIGLASLKQAIAADQLEFIDEQNPTSIAGTPYQL